ncbi:MAG TPA: TMEM175 family protein [Pyrinomonadaceae bacterium]|nr:TMEM175 family protein [Pyrinomonadaceae bacterium]
MTTGRVEAFSDGVIAIIITIMVLELRAPHDVTLAGLRPLLPVFGSYVMSYVYIGIYWSNHHHLFHAAQHVNGKCLWANLHLLFWLSLVPFTTAWMGENHFTTWPVALYGCVLLLAAISYTILVRALLSSSGNELLANALGSDFKGKISVVIYIVAIPLAFVLPWLALAGYILVAIIWLIPDRRIERRIAEE